MPQGKHSSGSAEPPRRLPLSKETEDDESRSSTLWVGNLPSDTADSDLMAVFGKHGALDCTMMRGSRSYAFMYFRGVDEAKAAKDALQGAAIRGNAVRIEFARPAKAAKQIWIGGFNSSISKEQLREEFSKYGKFEDYKFFRDRNSAIIEYYKLEDAISAHKNMNGKHLAGEQLRIDFVRFQPPRRDWPDRIDLRSGHIMSRTMGLFQPDSMRSFHDQTYLASNRILPPGGRSDSQPSNVLWIGYPPSVKVEYQMLHNAMILFGEIERINCFPNHAFVVFRSVDEARRAKEGLQGRLFNDPRIQILFSGSEATSKDNPSLHPALTELRPGLFVNDGSFGALELLAHGRPVAPNSFPSSLHPMGLPGPNISTRPFGTQSYDPYHAGPELHDIDGALHSFHDSDTGKSATTSWRNRSPSAPGILPSPSMRPHVRPFPDGRDGLDSRETKRTRIDGSSGDDGFYPPRRLDGAGNLVSGFSQAASSRTRFSPMVHERSPDIDFCWRGVIAKGGSHVCHARCIPIGKGIECPLPDIVNCSARTGLDMLTKHYAEAVGFDIAFFLPDSEDDFASYTEFLRYLGSKDRAGVAKLDDKTTLFLVPPSDFLSKVLKINGPERLYGVVLKFPQQALTAVPQRPQSSLPHGLSQYTNQPDPSNLQKGYTYVPQNEEHAMKIGYNQHLDEEVIHPSTGKSLIGHAEMQHAAQSSARDQVSNPVVVSKAEASLPPEFLATLASLIPKNSQSLTVQMPSTSISGPSVSASMLNDLSMTYPKVQEHQLSHSASLELPTYLPHHLGQQFSTQALPSQFPTYSNGPVVADQTVQSMTGSSQANNLLPQIPSILSRPLNSYGISQNGQLSGIQNSPHYLYGSSSTSQNNYVPPLLASNGSDVIGPGVQFPPGPSFSYNDQITNIPPIQMPSLPSSRTNADVATGQHGQSFLPGSGQGTSQGDADKNQRYQSTLQFAANLLLRIQQQQQAKNQADQGSGNQP